MTRAKNVHRDSTFALWTHVKCAANIHTSARVRRTAKQRKKKRSLSFMMARYEKRSKRVRGKCNVSTITHLLRRHTNLWFIVGVWHPSLVLTQNYWPQLRTHFYTRVFWGNVALLKITIKMDKQLVTSSTLIIWSFFMLNRIKNVQQSANTCIQR